MFPVPIVPYDAQRPTIASPAHEPTDRHGTPDRAHHTKKQPARKDRHDPKGPSQPKSERKPDSGRHRNPTRKGPGRHKSAPASPEQGDPVGGMDHRTPTLGTLPNKRGAPR